MPGPSGTAGADTSTASGAYAGADDPSSAIAGTAPGDDDVSVMCISVPTDTQGSYFSSQNYLRGVWQADESGHLTMYSIVPGWYSGRSTHFHIKVYTQDNGSIADNGTFIAGSAVQ